MDSDLVELKWASNGIRKEMRQMNNRWLILSHGFNMDGRAASQTITDKIPHLLAAGIKPQIISAVTGSLDRKVSHRQLFPWGPSGLRFDFRHWLRLRVGRGFVYKLVVAVVSVFLAPFIIFERVALGLSSQWSWAIPTAIVGVFRVWTDKVDLVYSTGGAWSAHLAGWVIKKVTGCVWIVELHDPLAQAGRGFADLNRDEKARLWLERKICSDADHVWWFTRGALERAQQRNPQLKDRGFSVLAGAEPPMAEGRHVYGEKLRISHFGSLAPGRSLKPFLAAVTDLAIEVPSFCDHLEVHIYGVALDKESRLAVEKLARDGLVICHGRVERDSISGRSGREQIMALMQESDVLLLLHGEGPECAEYIPSKFYEYLWARRPIFALTYENAEFDELLERHNAYQASTDDSFGIKNRLRTLHEDWVSQSLRSDGAGVESVKASVETILAHIPEMRA
jgi:hypothetical protein